ncbi:hypothetical protein JTB14_036863 [Gonioctena quinquepunctata]|nr:hypothetical protein JTB14_036863 [Gonioctena quinquepunctata]
MIGLPGMWPLYRLAFTNDDFIASYANVTGADTIEEPVFDTPQEVAPATSSVTPTFVSLGSVKKCGKFILTPDVVRHFPRPCIMKRKNGANKKGKSQICTDTPEKNRLEYLEYERGLRKKTKKRRKYRT